MYVTLRFREKFGGSELRQATDQVDFQSETVTVTIPYGETSATVNAVVVGDLDVESDEEFEVEVIAASEPMYSGSGMAIPITSFQTILNDD